MALFVIGGLTVEWGVPMLPMCTSIPQSVTSSLTVHCTNFLFPKLGNDPSTLIKGLDDDGISNNFTTHTDEVDKTFEDISKSANDDSTELVGSQ